MSNNRPMRDHPARRYQREFDAIMRQTEESAALSGALAKHSHEIANRKTSYRGAPVVVDGCSFSALPGKPEKPISPDLRGDGIQTPGNRLHVIKVR